MRSKIPHLLQSCTRRELNLGLNGELDFAHNFAWVENRFSPARRITIRAVETLSLHLVEIESHQRVTSLIRRKLILHTCDVCLTSALVVYLISFGSFSSTLLLLSVNGDAAPP